MDEWLPPVIRDSRLFMYPFYYFAYKGKNISETMNLKSKIFKWSNQEISEFYSKRDTRFSNSRTTDLSKQCLNYIFDNMPFKNGDLLDIGCGNGYFLKLANSRGFNTSGCDIIPGIKFEHSKYFEGNVEKLPFETNSFNIVTCFHTLEHVLDFNKAINELKRVTKNTLCVVVPCQRAYYYTLDEHVRFFPYKWMLEQEMKMKHYSCNKIGGDLVYFGDMNKEKMI